jgi:CRISPR system Cascade subunit CasA
LARLRFEPNPNQNACALTGLVDNTVVTGFTMRPLGVKYEGWRHPLTPYYKPRPDSQVLLPVHAQNSSIGYRLWIGLLYDDASTAVAACVTDAKHRFRGTSSVLAAGYVADNMKIVDYAEADLPFHIVADKEAQAALEAFTRGLIKAAELVAGQLRGALSLALDARSSSTLIEAPSERFWNATEAPFRNAIDAASNLGDDEHGDVARQQMRETWRTVLEKRHSQLLIRLCRLT